MNSYIQMYLDEIKQIIDNLDKKVIQEIIELLSLLPIEGGRLFLLGVGGGAAHASHAVNDFRKNAGIDSLTPIDNVSELTARINDEGWENSYSNWLRTYGLNSKDMVFIISVGGGSKTHNISVNLVKALEYSRQVGAKICGIVGRDGGFTANVADACLIIPTVNQNNITPYTESLQAMILHLLVSHPVIQKAKMKWESTDKS